jgi:hypothetical protein
MTDTLEQQAQKALEEAWAALNPDFVPYYLHAHKKAATVVNERQTPPSRSQPNTGGDVSDHEPS